MVGAHGATLGGASLELLLLAGALLFLGVVFLVQKATKMWVAIALIVAGALLAGGAFAFAEDAPHHEAPPETLSSAGGGVVRR